MSITQHYAGPGNEIILLDLFSGAGGFAKGLLNAGFTIKKHYFSEIDKYCIANYQYNFKNAKNIGDITKVKNKTISRPNVITFGSPCQDLSIAGKFEGLKGKRSSLFFEAVKIIRQCRPDVFVFENVKGLFSSNEGKDFEIVLQTLADIGLYDIQWQLLNTCWFLPQHRERLYIVAHLAEEPTPQIFPVGQSDPLPQTFRSQRQNPAEDIVTTLTKTYSHGVHGRGETYIRVKGAGLRRLTPTECERLQGFPDHWTRFGMFDGQVKEISDTQRYRMLGNAVSVPVVTEIGQRIRRQKRPENNSAAKLLRLELQLKSLQFKQAT